MRPFTRAMLLGALVGCGTPELAEEIGVPVDAGVDVGGDRAVDGSAPAEAPPAERIHLNGATWPTVRGAQVRVLDRAGRVLGEAQTDQAGEYVVQIQGAPARVVVEGAPEAEVVGLNGLTHAWPDGRLSAHVDLPVVSPLSDLAWTLGGPADHASVAAALAAHFNTTVDHLATSVPGPLDGPPTGPADWLAVARGCLETQAGEHPLALVEAYRVDAADGVVDGLADGTPVLPADPLRADLARRCLDWARARRLPVQPLMPGIELMAQARDAALFGDAPPEPADLVAPEVSVEFTPLDRLAAARGAFEPDGLVELSGRVELAVTVRDDRGIDTIELLTDPPIIGLQRMARQPVGGPLEYRTVWRLDARAAARILRRDAADFTIVARDLFGNETALRSPVRLGSGTPLVERVTGPGHQGPAGRWHTGADQDALTFTLEAPSDARLVWEVEVITPRGEVDALARGRGRHGDRVEVDLAVGHWPEGDNAVVIRVANPLGESAEHHLAVRVDRTAPAVQLQPGHYLDERDAQLVASELFLRGAERHEWDANTQRLPIHKIAAARGNWNPVDLVWTIEDAGTPWADGLVFAGSSALSFTRQGVAFRLEALPLGPELPRAGHTIQPTFSVTDLAGNTTHVRAPELVLHLLPPPVELTVEPAPIDPAALRGEHLRLGTIRVHNPWPEPVDVAVHSLRQVGFRPSASVQTTPLANFDVLQLIDMPDCMVAFGRPNPGNEIRVGYRPRQIDGKTQLDVWPEGECRRWWWQPPGDVEVGLAPTPNLLRIPARGHADVPVVVEWDPGRLGTLGALLASPDHRQPTGASADLGPGQATLFWAQDVDFCWDDCPGRWVVGQRDMVLDALTVEPVLFSFASVAMCGPAPCQDRARHLSDANLPGRQISVADTP